MLVNKTNNKITSRKIRLHRSVFSKVIGLMFSSSNAVHDCAHIFLFEKEQSLSLHMWFVFYPIDVLFLNKEKIVVDLKQYFLPFSFYSSKLKSKYFIELEKGKIKESQIRVGDKIEW